MANLLSELEMIDGDTSYLIDLYDESAHNMMGVLSELETSNKDTLVGAINSEVSARETADTNEATTRENADTALGGRIDNEITARENADTALGTRIDNNIVYNPSNLDGTGNNIGLKEGVYTVTSNKTISSQLVIPKGAIIEIDSGVTLTIAGQILAGRYPIFTGSGSVIVDSKSQPYGYPEWFGAVADGETDCTSAIQKCINTFAETLFTKGTYIVSNTLKITSSNKTLKGYGIWRNGTVIKSTSSSATILQCGTDTQPAQINSFLQDIRVENIEFTRNTTNWANQSAGILCQWILRSNFVDVMSSESSRPWLIMGCVYTRWNKCTAFSSTLADGDTTRQYAGFCLTANASIGSAGSNASIYFEQCSSTTGGIIYAQSWGVQAFGDYGIADTYIDKLESNGVAYGITFVGNNGRNSAHDIIITNCVLDAIKQTCIQIQNVAFGTVTIANNYMALGQGEGVQFGIYLNTAVNVSCMGNQIIGSVGTNVYGIHIESSFLCNCIGNMIYECELPENITTGIDMVMENSIYADATTTTNIVLLTTSQNVRIKDSIVAKATNGVNVQDGCTNCVVEMLSVYTGGITNPVLIAGSAPTQDGQNGDNYVVGYMAS